MFLNARFRPVDRWIDIEYVRVPGSPAQNVSGIQGTRNPFHQRTVGHVHIEPSEYSRLLVSFKVFGQLSITRVVRDFRNTHRFAEGINKIFVYITYVHLSSEYFDDNDKTVEPVYHCRCDASVRRTILVDVGLRSGATDE